MLVRLYSCTRSGKATRRTDEARGRPPWPKPRTEYNRQNNYVYTHALHSDPPHSCNSPNTVSARNCRYWRVTYLEDERRWAKKARKHSAADFTVIGGHVDRFIACFLEQRKDRRHELGLSSAKQNYPSRHCCQHPALLPTCSRL